MLACEGGGEACLRVATEEVYDTRSDTTHRVCAVCALALLRTPEIVRPNPGFSAGQAARTLGKTTTADFPVTGLDRFQTEVGAWAAATFPSSTPMTKARHLLREAGEVCELSTVLDFTGHMPDVLEPMREATREQLVPQLADECADVLLLLLHIAHAEGFSLLGAAHRKFTENQLRTWLKPDAQGVVEHDRAE